MIFATKNFPQKNSHKKKICSIFLNILWQIFCGKLFVANFWWQIFGGNFWWQTFGGKFLAVIFWYQISGETPSRQVPGSGFSKICHKKKKKNNSTGQKYPEKKSKGTIKRGLNSGRFLC